MSEEKDRTAAEVFADHLQLRVAGKLEEDLRRNYSEQVVLLTVNSNGSGHDAIRESAARLRRQLPGAEFTFQARQVHGPYALLVWSAVSERFSAVGGADTFVITDGKIVLQSIHYSLREQGRH